MVTQDQPDPIRTKNHDLQGIGVRVRSTLRTSVTNTPTLFGIVDRVTSTLIYLCTVFIRQGKPIHTLHHPPTKSTSKQSRMFMSTVKGVGILRTFNYKRLDLTKKNRKIKSVFFLKKTESTMFYSGEQKKKDRHYCYDSQLINHAVPSSLYYRIWHTQYSTRDFYPLSLINSE